jgi:hypothetical protein
MTRIATARAIKIKRKGVMPGWLEPKMPIKDN